MPNAISRDVVKVLSAMKKNDKHNYKIPVKPYEIAIVVGIIVIMIIISTQVHNTQPLRVVNPVDSDHLDPQTAKLAALNDAQLVPGKSVGRIRLGDSPEYVESIMGKPQLSDAAMCKSWSRWEWGEPQHVFEVFETCDPKVDMKKTVKQIRFSGISFETHDGISLKSTYSDIREKIPGLKAVDTFTDKTTGKPMIIMDQERDGIAFVFDAKDGRRDPDGKIHTIIVHERGTSGTETYLRPDWDLHPVK